jgi:hypothetical protein
MEWISVKDRLPTYEEASMTRECIVAVVGGTSQTSLYNNPNSPDYDDEDCEGFSYTEVSHWMPLPEPPQEEK